MSKFLDKKKTLTETFSFTLNGYGDAFLDFTSYKINGERHHIDPHYPRTSKHGEVLEAAFRGAIANCAGILEDWDD